MNTSRVSPSVRILRACLVSAVLLIVWGCGSGDPFSYVPVNGKVTYDDDSLIPAEELLVTFLPQAEAIDAKTHPRPGRARVDKATGTFHEVTSHTYGDGLVRGKHKVVIIGGDQRPLPPNLVPLEYSDPDKSPLVVDTAEQPFVLQVKKPSKR